MDAQDLWNIAYNQLELQFDRGTFDTWLRGAVFIGVEDATFVIGVRNEYARDMLQHRLYRNVRRVMSDVCGKPTELRFEVARAEAKPQTDNDMPLFRQLAQQRPEPQAPSPHAYRDERGGTNNRPLHERLKPREQTLSASELNPNLTFDRFIVNGSNRITYEAAHAVAESPGRMYNPFFVYGGVGLGKTHLLQAIAHACEQRGLRVIYVPSEAFTNDLIDSIRHKTTAMFRDKYRSVDVLLVDDVQFIAGKDSTQEEFFHTFNALYTFNKQIVLASDRHPRELDLLEDRLRSRFEGGLISDVQPLEFESRLAILEMWMHERGVRLERNVLQMIAHRAQSNVRELEGIFNQIVAKAQLQQGHLSINSAEITLERYEAPREHQWKRITITEVIEMTARHFNVKPASLTGKSRAARINRARQVAMYIARDMTDASLPQIGEVFGGRSHTTVLHGCNKIADEMEFDPSLCRRIDQIRDMLVD